MASRTPRNAPCSCGSGRKFKLCCGTTRDQERQLRRQFGVFEEIASLPMHFPQLRPRGKKIGALLDRAVRDGVDKATLADAVALLERRERSRIERSHAKEFPAVWRSLCAELGDEQIAREAVVLGAVLAALDERVPLHPELLALIEDTATDGDDPIEPLALALEAGDLWSLGESVQADEALASIPDVLDDDEYEACWQAVLLSEAKRLGGRWFGHGCRDGGGRSSPRGPRRAAQCAK